MSAEAVNEWALRELDIFRPNRPAEAAMVIDLFWVKGLRTRPAPILQGWHAMTMASSGCGRIQTGGGPANSSLTNTPASAEVMVLAKGLASGPHLGCTSVKRLEQWQVGSYAA
jgi:hypothetical protein